MQKDVHMYQIVEPCTCILTNECYIEYKTDPAPLTYIQSYKNRKKKRTY